MSNRHIAEVLLLKSAKIGADKLAEALEVALHELKKDKTEDVLTDKEKAYLEAALKPFKNRVRSVVKQTQRDCDCYYISVKVRSIQDNYIEAISFPLFTNGTMYNGMKTNQPYTLKELGLE